MKLNKAGIYFFGESLTVARLLLTEVLRSKSIGTLRIYDGDGEDDS